MLTQTRRPQGSPILNPIDSFTLARTSAAYDERRMDRSHNQVMEYCESQSHTAADSQSHERRDVTATARGGAAVDVSNEPNTISRNRARQRSRREWAVKATENEL